MKSQITEVSFYQFKSKYLENKDNKYKLVLYIKKSNFKKRFYISFAVLVMGLII